MAEGYPIRAGGTPSAEVNVNIVADMEPFQKAMVDAMETGRRVGVMVGRRWGKTMLSKAILEEWSRRQVVKRFRRGAW